MGNRARLTGLNVIGLKRRGVGKPRLHVLRGAFRRLFLGDVVFAERVAAVRADYGHEPLVAELLAFIDSPSKRGLIRTTATADVDEAA
jgi:UDP-N-acetylglucosamine acyltransferase